MRSQCQLLLFVCLQDKTPKKESQISDFTYISIKNAAENVKIASVTVIFLFGPFYFIWKVFEHKGIIFGGLWPFRDLLKLR